MVETVVETVVAAVKRTPHEKKQPALGVARAKPTKEVVGVVVAVEGAAGAEVALGRASAAALAAAGEDFALVAFTILF